MEYERVGMHILPEILKPEMNKKKKQNLTGTHKYPNSSYISIFKISETEIEY